MCEFLIQKKALTFYSQSLICHCNALVLLSFIILPYQTLAFIDEDSLPVPLFVRLTKKFVLVVEI